MVRPILGGAWFDLGYRFEVVCRYGRGAGHYQTEDQARKAAEKANQAEGH